MLFIDTRIDAPPAEAFAEAKARGDELVHIPALRCEPTCVALRLDGCGAAFAASPRAAKIAAGALLQYKGAVWAVGKTTADVLRGSGIPVAREGSTGGAAAFFAGLRAGGIHLAVLDLGLQRLRQRQLGRTHQQMPFAAER